MSSLILGTGVYLPEKILTNQDIEKLVDTNDEWIRTRTGIEQRHIGGPGEYTPVLGAMAARKALEMAGLEPADIDVIIVATLSSHMLMPSCACFVQAELQAENAFAFDVNAACSGFVYALDVGDRYVRTGNEDTKVLVIGAETMSTRLNWKDRNTCILFGDGAGAVVLGQGGDTDRGILGTRLFADGKLWNLLCMHTAESLNNDLQVEGREGSYMMMEGREVFRHAVKSMEEATRLLLEEQGVATEDLALFVPHQANVRIIRKLMSRLDLPEEKVLINAPQYGNTSAASIPIGLDEANRSGRIRPGDLVLSCSFGGGFTWGASLIKW